MRTLAFSMLIPTLIACDGVSGREARGRLDVSGTSHHADTLIAIDDLGRREHVALDSDGTFSVALDEGRTYAIGFADSAVVRRGVLAQLVFRTKEGWRPTMKVGAGSNMDFGVIRPVSEAAELEIELEHPRPEAGDDHGGRTRDCRDLGDDGAIDVMPAFLVVGETQTLDVGVTDAGTDDGPLHDRDDDLTPDLFDDDRDGDGLCDDDGEDAGTPGGEDGDAGVPDAEDAGEDDDGRADLPYDIRPAVGDTVQLSAVFLEKGPAPARILSVEMEAPAWRYEELSNDTPFLVTEADCEHEGNRDLGRDRIFVAWENADGSREIDHLDLRYCKD